MFGRAVDFLILLCLALAITPGCYEAGDYPIDFMVIKCFPADQQTNVSQNTEIVIRFSNPPDYKTVDGTKQVILVNSNNQVVPTTFLFQGELLTLIPVSPFGTNETYGLAVRPGVRSVFGSNIALPFYATFSTGSSVNTIPNFPPFPPPVPPPPALTGAPGTFTLTGPMAFARIRHTATKLANGKVLAVGGENGPPLGLVLRSCEIFDPATFQWTLSQSLGAGVNGMLYLRYGHTATLLQDGRVLVAGGTDNARIYDVAEIYNPVQDVFSVIPARMASTRMFHTAEILDNGNVLLIGGWANMLSKTSGTLSAQQGSTVGQPALSYLLDSMEVYDVFAGTFTKTASSLIALPLLNIGVIAGNRQSWWQSRAGTVPTGRCYHTSNHLPDGSVMICGGYSEPWFPQALSTADAQIFVPSGGSGVKGTVRHAGSDLMAPRVCHTATLITIGEATGMVVVFGGFQNSPFPGVHSSGEVFDYLDVMPTGPRVGIAGTFTSIAQEMSVPRRNHVANLLLGGKDKGSILIVGGARHLPNFNWAQFPLPRTYPWLEPVSCGACALNGDSELFDPFGSGRRTTSPYRGINATGTLAPTKDLQGRTTSSSQFYFAGGFFMASVGFSNGVVLYSGGAGCPRCFFGSWSYAPYASMISGGFILNGLSFIYNP